MGGGAYWAGMHHFSRFDRDDFRFRFPSALLPCCRSWFRWWPLLASGLDALGQAVAVGVLNAPTSGGG
jgi:hypothetical protein